MILQAILTSIAKELYNFVIFKGEGPDPLPHPLDPHMVMMGEYVKLVINSDTI